MESLYRKKIWSFGQASMIQDEYYPYKNVTKSLIFVNGGKSEYMRIKERQSLMLQWMRRITDWVSQELLSS